MSVPSFDRRESGQKGGFKGRVTLSETNKNYTRNVVTGMISFSLSHRTSMPSLGVSVFEESNISLEVSVLLVITSLKSAVAGEEMLGIVACGGYADAGTKQR